MRYIRLIIASLLIVSLAGIVCPTTSFCSERPNVSAQTAERQEEEKGFFDSIVDIIKNVFGGWISKLDQVASAPGAILKTVQEVVEEPPYTDEQQGSPDTSPKNTPLAEVSPQGSAPPDPSKTDFARLDDKEHAEKKDDIKEMNGEVAKKDADQPALVDKNNGKNEPVVFISKPSAPAPQITVTLPSSASEQKNNSDVFRLKDITSGEATSQTLAAKSTQQASSDASSQPSSDSAQTTTASVDQSSAASSDNASGQSDVSSDGAVANNAAETGPGGEVVASGEDTGTLNAATDDVAQTDAGTSDTGEDVPEASVVALAQTAVTTVPSSTVIASAATALAASSLSPASSSLIQTTTSSTVTQQRFASNVIANTGSSGLTATQVSSLNVLPVGSTIPSSVVVQTTDLPNGSSTISATLSVNNNDQNNKVLIEADMFVKTADGNELCSECIAELSIERVNVVSGERVSETGLLKSLEGTSEPPAEGVMEWTIDNYKVTEQTGDVQRVFHLKVKKGSDTEVLFSLDKVVYITPIININNIQNLQNIDGQNIPSTEQLKETPKLNIIKAL